MKSVARAEIDAEHAALEVSTPAFNSNIANNKTALKEHFADRTR
jgi:hypothetical protein